MSIGLKKVHNFVELLEYDETAGFDLTVGRDTAYMSFVLEVDSELIVYERRVY